MALLNPGLDYIENQLLGVMKMLKADESDRILLIITGLDLLLAATESSTQDILDKIQEWRQVQPLFTLTCYFSHIRTLTQPSIPTHSFSDSLRTHLWLAH